MCVFRRYFSTGHIQARFRIHKSIPTGKVKIPSRSKANTIGFVQVFRAVEAWKKFMPKNPVKKERGMNKVVIFEWYTGKNILITKAAFR